MFEQYYKSGVIAVVWSLCSVLIGQFLFIRLFIALFLDRFMKNLTKSSQEIAQKT